MSKIVAFYKAVEENKEFKDELLALDAKYKDKLTEENIGEIIDREVIAIADKYNYTLTQEDLAEMKSEEVDEKTLDTVSGGLMLIPRPIRVFDGRRITI